MALHSLKKLNRKTASLERKSDKINPKAVMSMAMLERIYQKYEDRKKAIINDPARTGSAYQEKRVVSGKVDKKGKFKGKKFVVCEDTSTARPVKICACGDKHYKNKPYCSKECFHNYN